MACMFQDWLHDEYHGLVTRKISECVKEFDELIHDDCSQITYQHFKKIPVMEFDKF